MRRLIIWSIGVSCLWVSGIVIFGALLHAQGGALTGEALGVIYAPALFVTVSLSDNAQHPHALLIIAALLVQTFVMALGVGALGAWRRSHPARQRQDLSGAGGDASGQGGDSPGEAAHH